MYDNPDWITATLDRVIGTVTSLPITAAAIEQTGLFNNLPSELQCFVHQNLPELADIKPSGRLCWYTDTFDRNFVIDWVPQVDGCIVVTGGSRHGKGSIFCIKLAFHFH